MNRILTLALCAGIALWSLPSVEAQQMRNPSTLAGMHRRVYRLEPRLNQNYRGNNGYNQNYNYNRHRANYNYDYDNCDRPYNNRGSYYNSSPRFAPQGGYYDNNYPSERNLEIYYQQRGY